MLITTYSTGDDPIVGILEDGTGTIRSFFALL